MRNTVSPDTNRNLMTPPMQKIQKTNLFDGIPASLPQEMFETLWGNPNVRIERIVSRGHHSPEGFWYDQAWHEWVLLLKGRAALVFEVPDEQVVLEPGDALFIPAGRRHRVAWTADDKETVWLAVHTSIADRS